MSSTPGPEAQTRGRVGSEDPYISVVVPTVDRVRSLARCLRGLAAQQDVPFEVVVVHDGHPDVERLLAEWELRLPLRVIRLSERGAPQKRNAGWRAARADVVAFTDDDCEPAPGWLKGVAQAFARTDAALVQGRVEPHPDDRAIDGPFRRTVEVTSLEERFPNANLAYRRSALESVGGYDEAFWGGGEDADLAWRVLESGGAAVYADDALAYHEVRAPGLGQHLRSLPRWQTLALMVRRHPESRRLAHRRWFWKPSHVPALLALVGLLGALRVRALVVLAVPLLAGRIRQRGVAEGLQMVVADLAELGVCVVGSVRYRAVLL